METHELKSNFSVTTKPVAKNLRVRDNDNAHLQRIGKNPVLKVQMRKSLPVRPASLGPLTIKTAKLRRDLNLWLQLYYLGYLGRTPRVSSAILVRTLKVLFTDASSSTFVRPLQKYIDLSPSPTRQVTNTW